MLIERNVEQLQNHSDRWYIFQGNKYRISIFLALNFCRYQKRRVLACSTMVGLAQFVVSTVQINMNQLRYEFFI